MSTHASKELRRINHLHWEIDAAYHEMSMKLGMSDSVMKIVYTICDNGDSCLLQDICRRSGLSKQTVNSAIRKLETEGIVYLETVGAKNKNVLLTDDGMRFVEQTAVRMIKVENEIFASWSKEDVSKYLELTEKFMIAIESGAKNM